MLQVYTGMMMLKINVIQQALVNTANMKFNSDICCVDLEIIDEEGAVLPPQKVYSIEF
jgi:hypothetical protein